MENSNHIWEPGRPPKNLMEVKGGRNFGYLLEKNFGKGFPKKDWA